MTSEQLAALQKLIDKRIDIELEWVDAFGEIVDRHLKELGLTFHERYELKQRAIDEMNSLGAWEGADCAGDILNVMLEELQEEGREACLAIPGQERS